LVEAGGWSNLKAKIAVNASSGGRFLGLLAGTASSIGMWAWVKLNPAALAYVAWFSHAKDMAENMYRALWSWIVCVVVNVIISLLTKPKPEAELRGLVYGATDIPTEKNVPFYRRALSSGPVW
jgi:solute:Na+ symporter, SSS family